MPHPLSLLKKLPVFFCFYLIVNVAHAQVYNSSTSAATGGTGRATVEPGDVSFLNPGTMVHLKGRHFFSSFAENQFAASLSDNTKDSAMPAAFAFVKKTSDVSLGKLEESDMALTLAEFATEKWAMGVTGHYREQKLPNSSYRQTNADIGFIYTPRANIGVALVGYNLFGEDTGAPEELRRKTSAGAGFNYIHNRMVRFRLDATTESEVMGGLETYVNNFLVSRLGYYNDTNDNRELLTAGLGFNGPRFALNYAYEGNPKESGDYRHSVDLGIPF